MEVIKEQAALPIEEMINELNRIGKNVIFVGDGISVQKDYIRNNLKIDYTLAPVYAREQKASSVIGVALNNIKNNKIIASRDFKPIYLRKSQAERELEMRMANNK